MEQFEITVLGQRGDDPYALRDRCTITAEGWTAGAARAYAALFTDPEAREVVEQTPAERLYSHADMLKEDMAAFVNEIQGSLKLPGTADDAIRLQVKLIQLSQQASDASRAVSHRIGAATHRGLSTHDGYAPHSHEVRSDHAGVKKV